MTTTTTGGPNDIFKAGNLCRSRHSLRRRLYLLVTFINNLSIFKGKNDAPRRVISLTRLKARNWFSSGANPTRRDRVHADEKEGRLLTPVHRRLLNRSDIASGMRQGLAFATSVLRSPFYISLWGTLTIRYCKKQTLYLIRYASDICLHVSLIIEVSCLWYNNNKLILFSLSSL